jgi:hypothetical protein
MKSTIARAKLVWQATRTVNNMMNEASKGEDVNKMLRYVRIQIWI